MKKVLKLIFVGLMLGMVIAVSGVINAQAMIDSTVLFDIAWSGMTPTDTTYWGTPYQVNSGDLTIYDGMFEYKVSNWNTSSAAIRRFEVWFPSSVYSQKIAVLGTPAGWDIGINSGTKGSIIIWGKTTSNPILPGQSLNGFLVDFSTTLSNFDRDNFVQVYDVYENSDKSGDYGKDVTAPIPEPASMLMFGTGLIGLVGIGKRKNFN